MNGDWFKVYRGLLDSQEFNDADPFVLKLFIWCLVKANWKPTQKGGFDVLPGQFITGEKSAANQLEISTSKWRRGIAKLKKFGSITTKATNRFTLITVVNWYKYQEKDNRPTSNRRAIDEQSTDERRTNDEQSADERRAIDEQSTTIEEGKKERRKERERGGVQIPKSLDTESFRDTWQKYVNWWLAVSGTRLPDIQAQFQLGDLQRRGHDKAVRDLKLTMTSSTRPGTIWDSQRANGGTSGGVSVAERLRRERLG